MKKKILFACASPTRSRYFSKSVGMKKFRYKLVLPFFVVGVSAQTVVPNGSSTTETESNGEVLEVASGTTVSVNGAPTIALSNDNSVLNNQGSLSTQGVTRHYPRTRQCFRRRQRGR